MINLSYQQLNGLYPFFILLDQNLNMIELGHSLLNYLPKAKNQPFKDYFKIQQPKISADFFDLMRSEEKLCVFELRQGMKLKGQIAYLADQNQLLFTGSPWIVNEQQLSHLNLKTENFAIHDSLLDYLFILSAKNKVLKETRLEMNQLKLQSNDPLQDIKETGQVLNQISHDLRTPLNIIIGFSDMLSEEMTEERKEEWVSDINKISYSSRELLHMIDNLIDLLKRESSSLNLSNEDLDNIFNFKEKLKQKSNQKTRDLNKEPLRVLSVDDSALNQSLVERILSDKIFHLTAVFNGTDALQTIEQNNFDLVLLDVEMPDISGIDVARQIRKNMGLKVPIIGMTGHQEQKVLDGCLEAGMDSYLIKPISKKEFLKLVISAISHVSLPEIKDVS